MMSGDFWHPFLSLITGFVVTAAGIALIKVIALVNERERKWTAEIAKEAEWMRDRRGLRVDGIFQGHFHKDDPVFNGMWSDEAVRARALKDSNGTVEHKVAKDNGDFCEMLDKPRVAGGEGDRLIEGLLNEIIGEKECERRVTAERTRLYREAHCSQCGQPLRKEGQE